MPDQRRHRGPHPEDRRLFAPARLPTLRLAVSELSWLLSRGYAEPSALALVGNRHELDARQREAVRRSACADDALARRAEHRLELTALRGAHLALDGYNQLITLETALSGGVVLVGRDGCLRDLAAVRGTHRAIEETLPALRLLAAALAAAGVARCSWLLDRPVSNSGRLRSQLQTALDDWPGMATVELSDDPDGVLVRHDGPVASSDSWILDRCACWTNLLGAVVATRLPDPWLLELG